MTRYSIDEIPFADAPVILDVEDQGIIHSEFGSERNLMLVERNKIEITTNAGKRIVEYKTCELIKATNL